MWLSLVVLAIASFGAAWPEPAGSQSQPSTLPAAASRRWPIITFGTNTAEWNKLLHVTGIRMGCNKEPEVCVKVATAHVQTQHVNTMHIAMELGPGAEAYAERYSQLSLGHPFLREISIDDFVSTYYHAYKASHGRTEALLRATIEKTKTRNPALGFGVTLYETDLKSGYLTDKRLASDIRRRIDYVHLFIHNRENGPHYEEYVRASKQIFPGAQIIAGSYPFDRIDYVPCSSTGKASCSNEQEIGLYKASIVVQTRLLKEGVVYCLEFYPANFGREDEWNGWDNPKFCRPERRQACIEHTKTMRQVVLSILRSSGILE